MTNQNAIPPAAAPEAVRLLDDVSAALANVLAHHGDAMTPADRTARAALATQARAFCDTALRGPAPAADAYTALEVEAALCVWEEMLDRARQRDGQPWAAPMIALWDDVGVYQMRAVARALGRALEPVWHTVPEAERDGYSYDWGFIPDALATIDWQAVRKWCFAPDSDAFPLDAAAVLAAVRKVRAFASWWDRASNAAGRLWGYSELLRDDPDGARRAFDKGDDPAAYIEAIGRELELSEPDPFTLADLARRFPVSQG